MSCNFYINAAQRAMSSSLMILLLSLQVLLHMSLGQKGCRKKALEDVYLGCPTGSGRYVNGLDYLNTAQFAETKNTTDLCLASTLAVVLKF